MWNAFVHCFMVMVVTFSRAVTGSPDACSDPATWTLCSLGTTRVIVRLVETDVIDVQDTLPLWHEDGDL